MNDIELKDLFINWKGLELIQIIKNTLKWLIIILSIIFTYISLTIQNYYILGASLTFIFIQLLTDSNKEYSLKYKELFNRLKNGENIEKHQEWINFLEKTKGLNSLSKWILGIIYNKRYLKHKRK